MFCVISGNSSNEDLENFQKQFITPHDGEEEEEENFVTQGQQEEEATTTEKSSVRLDSAASFPVSLVRTASNHVSR